MISLPVWCRMCHYIYAPLQTEGCLFPWQPILLRLVRYFEICISLVVLFIWPFRTAEVHIGGRNTDHCVRCRRCKWPELRTIFNGVDEENVSHTCVVRTLIYLGYNNSRAPLSVGHQLWVTNCGFDVSSCVKMSSQLIQIKSLLLISFSILAHMLSQWQWTPLAI